MKNFTKLGLEGWCVTGGKWVYKGVNMYMARIVKVAIMRILGKEGETNMVHV